MDKKPRITVSSLDLDRLESLLEAPAMRALPGAVALHAELERAEIVDPDKVPPNVVTMNSTVRFVTDSSGHEFEYTLVYPKDANNDAGRISVLAPVGSALLGLAVGDEIEWPRPGGGTTRVRIVEVTFQPERAGELHR
ncbi:nucleoside diphosphate kinase regulator [Dokdonella sp.]|uniref:nucleoside diphosphate kinase regulator n=1 Tax=Dokdonella sp. TaxID=2291710 RepID=UPI0031BF88B7|nr:nucleoside diphosphate kinase regulator [Dokdonella sp.]